ncbi:outer membrane protein assembly factor BamA [Bacteroidota bacterium]
MMKFKTILVLPILAIATYIYGQNEFDVIDYNIPLEYEIAEVKVSGVKFLDEIILVQLSGLSVGQKITIPSDQISKVIEKYWKQGLFSDVKVFIEELEDNKVIIEIELKERSRLYSITYEGIKKSDEEDIEEKVNLKRGSQVTDNVLSNTKNLIEKHFVEKGYLDVDVNIIKVADTIYQNSVNLIVMVDKKKRVKIKEINFVGNKALSEGKLRRAMKETKRKRWYNLAKPSKYIVDKYRVDKQGIIEKYNELGYRDAKIIKDTVYEYDDKTLALDIYIDEGRKYFIRNIEWVGNTIYSSEMLDKILSINAGDPYDQTLLSNRLYGDEDGISTVYLDNGYLFFSVTPVESRINGDSIDLEMRIFEGEQASVKKVTVKGNDRTNEHVIRRELRSTPGDLFSKTNITRSIRELANLQYFNPEKLNVNPTPDPVNKTVNLEYIVEEKSTDQLELSGGYGAGMFVGTIGLRFSNFSIQNTLNREAWKPLPSGDGQTLSIRAQATGKSYQSYNISFVEPWLGGKKPNSFSVSLYHSNYTNLSRYYSSSYYNSLYGSDYYGLYGGGEVTQYMKNTGISLGLGRRLSWPDDYFTLYNEISFQQYRLKNWQSFIIFSNGRANKLSLTTSFGRNSVDQFLYPRRGSDFSLSVELTPPYSLLNDKDYKNDTSLTPQDIYGWIEYNKYKFSGKWYLRIISDLVLATKTEFGYLNFYNKDIGPPPFEGFEVGGDGLYAYYYYGREAVGIRGYEDRSLTPYRREQGNLYTKYSLELRYPVSLNPQATVYLLSFAEAGNSWYEFSNFNPFAVKRSAGVGIRLFLPMFGLLGFDYGFRFDKTSLEEFQGIEMQSKGKFHFIIGQQF